MSAHAGSAISRILGLGGAATRAEHVVAQRLRSFAPERDWRRRHARRHRLVLQGTSRGLDLEALRAARTTHRIPVFGL
jgi:hypothetical protein